MLAFLKKLFGQTEPKPEAEPLTQVERSRLEHRRRQLQRQLRRAEKRGVGQAGGPAQIPVNEAAAEAARKLQDMRVEIREIDARLGADAKRASKK
jgi:hypothetical protein